MCLGGIFDYPVKKDRLAEVELELAEPSVWDDPKRAQELGRERSSLEAVVATIDTLDSGAADAGDLLDMAVEEDDQDTVDVVVRLSADILDEELNLVDQIASLNALSRAGLLG